MYFLTVFSKRTFNMHFSHFSQRMFNMFFSHMCFTCFCIFVSIWKCIVKKSEKNILNMHCEKSEKCIPSGCGHLGFEPTTGTYVFAFWSCYMQALVWWELHRV
jgi:hypothetical protein